MALHPSLQANALSMKAKHSGKPEDHAAAWSAHRDAMKSAKTAKSSNFHRKAMMGHAGKC